MKRKITFLFLKYFFYKKNPPPSKINYTEYLPYFIDSFHHKNCTVNNNKIIYIV